MAVKHPWDLISRVTQISVGFNRLISFPQAIDPQPRRVRGVANVEARVKHSVADSSSSLLALGLCSADGCFDQNERDIYKADVM